MDFGKKLQKLRRADGLSQEQLAERLGVTRQSVSKWESALAYPEMDKIIELSRMFRVSLDELLQDGELSSPAAAPPAPKRALWPLAALVISLCLALAGGIALYCARSPSDTTAAAPVPPELSTLREYYFNFAQDYRLDYVPDFDQGSPPKDSTEYLYFAYVINLDNWGDDKGVMSRAYVDEIALSYFGVSGLDHRSLFKGWELSGDWYTAYPDSVSEPPLCLLREYSTYWEDGLQYHRVVLDFCQSADGSIPSPEETTRLRGQIVSGDLTGLAIYRQDTFLYCSSHLNFEKPLFLSHSTAYDF